MIRMAQGKQPLSDDDLPGDASAIAPRHLLRQRPTDDASEIGQTHLPRERPPGDAVATYPQRRPRELPEHPGHEPDSLQFHGLLCMTYINPTRKARRQDDIHGPLYLSYR